jgi:hypothetical protein
VAAAAAGIPAAGAPAGAGAAVAGTEALSADILAAPQASLEKTPITVNLGNQIVHLSGDRTLGPTWQTFLNANAPKEFATATDAARYLKKTANQLLTTPAARAGFSGFAGVLHTLNEHVPLAGRGIVVGGQTIADVHIENNSISGVLMGISTGVSHRASAAETKNKQRTPDHMETVRIAGNTIACAANDVASKNARFGVFVGSASSLVIEDNDVSLAPVGIASVPPADGIRVVGYLGPRAIIRGNHTQRFAMGIRIVALTGNGPGQRAPGAGDASYLQPIRPGHLWLVADNVIETASASPPAGPFTSRAAAQSPVPYVEAPACMRVDNAHL